MRARFALVAALSSLTLACVAGAPTEPPRPVTLARRAPTLERLPLAGVLRAPASLIGNHGGGLVSDKGLGLIGNSAFRVLAAEPWTPVAGATVKLVHADGRPVEGVASVTTGDDGRFELAAVPEGGLYRVQAAAFAVSFETLVRPESKKSEAEIDPATTIVANHLRGRLESSAGAIDRVSIARFEGLSHQLRETLEREALPLDLSSAEAMEAVFERASRATPAIVEAQADLVTEATRPAPEPEPDPEPKPSAATPGPAATGTPVALVVSGLAPARGSAGMRVTIDGTGFPERPDAVEVAFGGVRARVVEATASRLTVEVPPGARSGPVTLGRPGGATTRAGAFEAVPAGTVLLTAPVGRKPLRLAFDPRGRLWVTNQEDYTAMRLDATGAVLETHTVGFSPWGLAFDALGRVWVANRGSNSVTRLTPDQAPVAFPAGQTPEGVAVAPDGDVWVSAYNSGTLTRLDPETGEVRQTVGGLATPTRLATSALGDVWALQWSGQKLTQITAAGTTRQIEVGLHPTGLAVTASGEAWVAVSGANRVCRVTREGVVAQQIPIEGAPEAVAIGQGVLWITHAGSGQLTRHTLATGESVRFEVAGGQTLNDVAIGPAGWVWVSHAGNAVSMLAP